MLLYQKEKRTLTKLTIIVSGGGDGEGLCCIESWHELAPSSIPSSIQYSEIDYLSSNLPAS